MKVSQFYRIEFTYVPPQGSSLAIPLIVEMGDLDTGEMEMEVYVNSPTSAPNISWMLDMQVAANIASAAKKKLREWRETRTI